MYVPYVYVSKIHRRYVLLLSRTLRHLKPISRHIVKGVKPVDLIATLLDLLHLIVASIRRSQIWAPIYNIYQ